MKVSEKVDLEYNQQFLYVFHIYPLLARMYNLVFPCWHGLGIRSLGRHSHSQV